MGCFCWLLLLLLLPLLLFLLSVKLWALYCLRGRDPSCPLPLPPGSMGLPFFGETLQLLLQRRRFLQAKRRKYGPVYKTHLFGRPTVRVMGADNVRRVLLGEHRLVAVQWPASVRAILGPGCLSNLHDGQHKRRKKVILRAFSREALAHYIPAIQEEVSACLRRWLRKEEEEEEEEKGGKEEEEGGSPSSLPPPPPPPLLVYPALKRLMFRIATRILLGLPKEKKKEKERKKEEEEEEEEEERLVEAFEEMVRNLFSLPIDVPFSGLYKGLRARGVIHAKIEESIRAKLAAREPSSSSSSSSSWGSKDALQLLMEHTQSDGEQLSMQELKESATELLFGGHETTASAATSLIIFLGLHHEVLRKVRKELQEKGLLSKLSQEKHLEMDVLEQLKYTGCVVKETLRLSPPVPGGFRVALKTFELNGYQIPKGWNVIYSISDTHEVAELFTNKEEFNPDRFMSPFPEDVSRFSFIPFGGGLRSCVGKEFAKMLLKIFTVELARNCDWQLINGPPTMKTGPTVYPEDNLPAKFRSFNGQV